MVKTKVCSCCKKELPVSEFWVSRARKDGLQIYCKKCKCVKDLIARKKRQDKKRLEREKLRIYKRVKESKTNTHWSYPFGGYKITIQNYVKNGEFKYNILPIGGKLFATNSKNEFMDYLEAI
jgi:hypothetical protein